MTISTIEIKGPRGDQGPPGLDGRDGRDGRDGGDNHVHLNDDTYAFLHNVENETSIDESIIKMVPELLAKVEIRKAGEQNADLIVTNITKLYTVDNNDSVLNNVNIVIKGGKITHILNDSELSQMNTNAYKIVNANGAFAYPGCRESHFHLYQSAEKLLKPDVTTMRSIDEFKSYLTNWIENNPLLIRKTTDNDSVIEVTGMDEYNLSDWPVGVRPDERLFPTELNYLPIIINRVDGHSTLLNRAAQDLITLRTGIDIRDPTKVIGDPDSIVIGDDYGWYVDQFILRNGEQISISLRVLDIVPFTKPQKVDVMIQTMKRQLSYGYVGLNEMSTRNTNLNGHIETELIAETQSNMSQYISWNYQNGWGGIDLDDPAVAKNAIDGRQNLHGWKFFIDGGMGSKSALVSKPYSDNTVTNHPANFSGTNGLIEWHGIAEEDQVDYFTKIMAKGYRVTIHAIGDLGCTKAIDLFENIYMSNPEYKKLRNVIAHCQYIQPEDLKRMAELEIIADYQPKHQHTDSRFVFKRLVSLTDAQGVPYKTPDGTDITEHDTLLIHYPTLFNEVSKTYSWKTAFDAGVTVCFGSDAAVEPTDWRIGMFYATTRLDRSEPPRRWLSNTDGEWVGDYAIYDQTVTRQQALRAYTINNAYLMNQEKESGSLEIGKNADFILLEEDVMEVSDTKMLDINTVATYMRGLKVYDHVGNENYQDKYNYLSAIVSDLPGHAGHEGPPEEFLATLS